MSKHTPGPWVHHNPLTQTYDTQDGTKVPVEVVDAADCMADVIVIAGIREKQRAATRRAIVRAAAEVGRSMK